MEELVLCLDICSATSETFLLIKAVKKLKKEITKSLSSSKQIDAKFSTSPCLNLGDEHLVAVVRVLKEANLTGNSVFRSLLQYFSAPVWQPKTSRWLLVSRLLHQRMMGYEAQRDPLNEVEQVDAALNSSPVQKLSRNEAEEMIQCACQRLKALETCIKILEKELESLFRGLIHARVMSIKCDFSLGRLPRL
ncbi:hypothetical protein Ancab_026674 [Ancistrocladus abbreviatus]